MAWCWGMYVNGIAVYGRDPLLTCDYALFLVHDQHCPIDIDIGGATATVTTMTITNPPQQDDEGVVGTASGLVPLLGDLLFQLLINPGGDIDGISDSPDWTNCSNSGYHP